MTSDQTDWFTSWRKTEVSFHSDVNHTVVNKDGSVLLLVVSVSDTSQEETGEIAGLTHRSAQTSESPTTQNGQSS